MVADVKALIGAVDDDGVVVEIQFLKRGAQSADAFVNSLNAAQIIFRVTLKFPADEILALELGLVESLIARAVMGAPRFHLSLGHAGHIAARGTVLPLLNRRAGKVGRKIHKQVVVRVHVPINLHLLMPYAGGVVLIVVKKRVGLGDVNIVIELKMAQRRHPSAVRCLVLHHEHEGLVVRPVFLQPIHREIGHHIRRVAVNAHLALGGKEIRIVV